MNDIWYDPPVEQANREEELRELSNMLGDFDSCLDRCPRLATKVGPSFSPLNTSLVGFGAKPLEARRYP